MRDILLPSNSKIEDRAIGALSNIIDDHATMRHKFNIMDKEMSWDGDIWLYQNVSTSCEKDMYDDKVPVQVKGHIDKEEKYINKQHITYEVDLADLRVYFRDRGVLFFEVFMSEDGKKREVFYASLFPTKIKYYLEKASKKGNKGSINIAFRKLPKKPDDLYAVVKQFSNESKKQGFGHEQLVQNAIKVEDMDKVKEISASVVGASNEYEFLQRLGSGDVSFYGKMKGVPISIPLEWKEGSIYYLTEAVEQEISVGGKQYYEKYKIRTSSQDEILIMPSDNLTINLRQCKFTFKAQTDIKGIRVDAEFLLALQCYTEYLIAGHSFPFGNLKMPDQLKQELEFYIDLDDTLSMINFEYEKAFKDISLTNFKQLINLVAMRKGEKNNLLTDNVHIYNWKIDDKYVPIIVFKNENGGENKLFNAIYTTGYQPYVANKNNEHFKVPTYACIAKHVMEALYEYKYDFFYEQFENADINIDTENALICAALNLIHAYDGTKDERLLEVADYILKKLIEILGQDDYLMINELQIKKRLSGLDETDKKTLSAIESDDFMLLCGKYILLDSKGEFKKYFKKLTEDEQKMFSDFPIYTLLCTL